jgi:MFS family permease
MPAIMRRVLWPLAVMATIQLLATMTFLTVPVLAPALAPDIGVEASRIGVYSALVFAGATLISLVSGPLIGRFGAVRMCQVGLALAAVSLAATTLGSLPLILVSAVLLGIGYGPATPAGSHVLARVTPAEIRGIVFSIKQSGVPLGGAVVGLAAPLVSVWAGWRVAVLVIAALALFAALALQPVRARLDRDRQPGLRIAVDAIWSSVALVAGQTALRRIAFACFAFAGAQLCLFAVLVAYLVTEVGLDHVAAGIAYATMQIAGVVARVVWGWLVDRLIAARAALGLIGLGSTVFVLATSAMTPEWPYWGVLLVAVLLGITVSGWNGIALAEVARVAPDHVGMATAGTVVFTYFGIVVGPSAFSAVVAATGGYVAAYYVLGLLTALAGVILLRRAPAAS